MEEVGPFSVRIPAIAPVLRLGEPPRSHASPAARIDLSFQAVGTVVYEDVRRTGSHGLTSLHTFLDLITQLLYPSEMHLYMQGVQFMRFPRSLVYCCSRPEHCPPSPLMTCSTWRSARNPSRLSIRTIGGLDRKLPFQRLLRVPPSMGRTADRKRAGIRFSRAPGATTRIEKYGLKVDSNAVCLPRTSSASKSIVPG